MSDLPYADHDKCLKRAFPTRLAAEKSLRSIRSYLFRLEKQGRRPPQKMPQKVYGPCPEGNYHLTSRKNFKVRRKKANPEKRWEQRLVKRLEAREDGCCARCGGKRANRRWGRNGGAGSAQVDGPPPQFRASNVALFCFSCWQTPGKVLIEEGWLIDRFARPERQKVLYRGRWVLLDDQGKLTPLEDF